MAYLSRSQGRSGITIIEISITVLVMGILAAVATPSYTTAILRYRADFAARRIAADIQFARTEANRSGQVRTIQFDTLNSTYTLVNVVDINASTNAYFVELAGDPFHAAVVSVDFDGDADVQFDIFGRPDSSGTVVVQAGSVQKTINLSEDGTTTIL